MIEETVEKILRDFGLTKKEIEVYVFLARHGTLKTRQTAKQIRKDKAQVLRILKSLEKKGLVESTLEAPKRFSAVPLEKVLDAFIKAKRNEANIIESAKRSLVVYWKSIGKKLPEAPPEKFVLIEGDDKVYTKISQMITETKNQLSVISSASDLIRAAQMEVFDVIISHPSQSKIQVRFLTELFHENSNTLKTLLKKTAKAGINFRSKNPDLGLKPFPRMVTKDTVEVLLFINPPTEEIDTKRVGTGLWTNCKTLVETFSAVFEDLWRNASTASKETKIATDRSIPKTFILSNLETIPKKYAEIINSAKKEITLMTSSQGLIDLCSNSRQLKDLTEKGVSVKVMAPTTIENLTAVQQLSRYCQVRHAPESHLKTTIIDGTHLFQFRNPSQKQQKKSEEPRLGAFYTRDNDLVAKTEKMLNEVWQKAQIPSTATVESILNPPPTSIDPFPKMKLNNPYIKRSVNIEEFELGPLTEKDVLSRILNAKKITAKNPSKDINTLCGSNAHAVIHPPKHFNLPDMIITVWHCDKRSSWGIEDWLTVSLWLKTPKGYRFTPVAHVTDNPEALEFRRGVYSGTPAGHNCQLVNKDQFQVQVYGNTLFAGWTNPIQLMPASYVLPPSCIMFEGYGKVRTVITKTRAPSGRTQVTEANRFNAFVTFFHPASKYSGPGTDGIFNRDAFFTAYPPK